MISVLKMFFGWILLTAGTVVFAQSPAEDAARLQAERLPFLIATSKQCKAFEGNAPLMQPQYTKDALGRINTARNQYGHDFAFEYLGDGTVPVAIIAYGRRIALDQQPVANEQLLEQLRARAILYNQVKEACGLAAAGSGTSLGGNWIWEEECWRGPEGATSACGGSVPYAWFEAPFWQNNWMPYYHNFSPVVPPPLPRCVTECQTFCSDTSRSVDIACGAIAGSVAIGNVGAGVLVAAACLSGSHVGHMICRDGICWTRCGY